MCQGNPVLRILGFIFLLIALLAAGIGFLAPFWIRNSRADPDGLSIKDKFLNAVEGSVDKMTSVFKSSKESKETVAVNVAPSTTTPASKRATSEPVWRMEPDDEDNDEFDVKSNEDDTKKKKKKRQLEGFSTPSNNGGVIVPTPFNPILDLLPTSASRFDDRYFWEGLWAKCLSNLTCRCFAQDEFAMEKEFPDWHKAAQGLYSLGFLIYVITILIGGFYLCCRCCKESIKLATTLGSFTLSGIILIALSLVVYGGFSYVEREVEFEGTDIVFEWGYFLAIASLGPAILAAIFYLIDGCRSTIVVEHDDCETAKMV